MIGMFRGVGINLIDFKLEFGRIKINGKNEIILADEINRAPAKVQSALLEAMQEKQVTIGEETFKLEEPFLVMATQNPIDQEGTYPLPEAQVDRFMLKTVITYPELDDEKLIMRANLENTASKVKPVVTLKKIITAQKVVFDILQHRIGISYEAEAENMSSVDIITKIVNEIAVP